MWLNKNCLHRSSMEIRSLSPNRDLLVHHVHDPADVSKYLRGGRAHFPNLTDKPPLKLACVVNGKKILFIWFSRITFPFQNICWKRCSKVVNDNPCVKRAVAAIMYHVFLLANAEENVKKFENTFKILVFVIKQASFFISFYHLIWITV